MPAPTMNVSARNAILRAVKRLNALERQSRKLAEEATSAAAEIAALNHAIAEARRQAKRAGGVN